jgi:hypothetical protein
MPENRYERHWGEEPPINLHFQAFLNGRLVEPWNVPIVVDYVPEPSPRVRVSKQGEDGTIPKHRITGESARLSGTSGTVFVAGHGEPMAGDPVSSGLRSAERMVDPGL